jgi:hypothetical protein
MFELYRIPRLSRAGVAARGGWDRGSSSCRHGARIARRSRASVSRISFRVISRSSGIARARSRRRSRVGPEGSSWKAECTKLVPATFGSSSRRPPVPHGFTAVEVRGRRRRARSVLPRRGRGPRRRRTECPHRGTAAARSSTGAAIVLIRARRSRSRRACGPCTGRAAHDQPSSTGRG